MRGETPEAPGPVGAVELGASRAVGSLTIDRFYAVGTGAGCLRSLARGCGASIPAGFEVRRRADFMGAKLDRESNWPLPSRIRRFDPCRAHCVEGACFYPAPRRKIVLVKRCTRCKVEKPVGEFHCRARAKDGLQPSCKACAHDAMVAWYQQNSEHHRANRQARKERIRTEFRTAMVGLRCIDCGEDDPCVLEFDHVRGQKTCAVSVMVGSGWSLSRIMEEVAKCEVRCANCHRRRTFARKVAFFDQLKKRSMLGPVPGR